MRGAVAYIEAVFSTVRLEDFVPAKQLLRLIRQWVNGALASMDSKFSAMCEADVMSGRPSIAPEKLMRAMLPQVLYSLRSERQLVEQVQYNLLFHWFVGLAIEDTVWNHSLFSKNRERLIEHDAVTELLNATVQMAGQPGLLSGEHFCVGGTSLQAWASHKSMRTKHESDDGRPPEDGRGGPRSNGAHGSTSDPESRLHRKSSAAPALPSYLGYVLADNRHGLVLNVQASTSDSTAERGVSAQVLADFAGPGTRITATADKAYGTKNIVKACREIDVTPLVAQSTTRKSGSAIDGRTTRHVGYDMSRRKRKCIEQCFGWGKVIGAMRQVMVQGPDKADQLLALPISAYSLWRLRTLVQLGPQCAQ